MQLGGAWGRSGENAMGFPNLLGIYEENTQNIPVLLPAFYTRKKLFDPLRRVDFIVPHGES